MSSWREGKKLFGTNKTTVSLILYGVLTLLPLRAQETRRGPETPATRGANASEQKSDPSNLSQGTAAPNARDTQTAGLRPPLSGSFSHELSFDDRVALFRKSIFTPTTIAAPALGAAIDQWQNEPSEWEQGMAGYGRRLGSGIGRNLSNKTIIFGVAALDAEDPRYFPSDSPGVFARSKHAVASAFVSYREDGSRMPAYAHIAGAYGSSFLAMTWYPPSRSNTQHALKQGTTKLAMNAGMNILREFWPDLRRGLHLGR